MRLIVNSERYKTAFITNIPMTISIVSNIGKNARNITPMNITNIVSIRFTVEVELLKIPNKTNIINKPLDVSSTTNNTTSRAR